MFPNVLPSMLLNARHVVKCAFKNIWLSSHPSPKISYRRNVEVDLGNMIADNENNPDPERSEIREELRNMSFEDLMKLKEELGSKVYNEAVFGTKRVTKVEPEKNFKRENKNRPREMSAKRPVPLINNTVKKSELVIRDPRFDSKCGEYDTKTFKQNYEFITDIRKNEIEELRAKLTKVSNEDERNRINFLIQRLENQNREEEKRKRKEELLKEEQEQIKKSREEGKQTYYPRKKELRARELVNQFVELKETGKLARHLEKRRKKNAAKDRKKFSFD